MVFRFLNKLFASGGRRFKAKSIIGRRGFTNFETGFFRASYIKRQRGAKSAVKPAHSKMLRIRVDRDFLIAMAGLNIAPNRSPLRRTKMAQRQTARSTLRGMTG